MPEQTDSVVLRSRLEPFFPEGLDERGKEVAVKYLGEIAGIEIEKVAILLAFEHVMVEQLTVMLEKFHQKPKGSGLILPKSSRRF